ncbi:MAG TPA: sigma-54 dependent transcriptional regulator [Planctomycetota bacterium]|jgi:two-component system nitrogen regulation response regulator NtrX|nr:sigma-54 dependent transcriptional regulator [Planctomycetota bacterium]
MTGPRTRRVVLLVDDAPDIRSTLADLLQYEGFETRAAGRGEEALAALSREPIDVVLLDIKMPGRDGLEVLAEIRERFPDPAVLMISGHGDIPSAVESIRRGALDFLEKPLDSERVMIAVRRALRTRELERENRRLREEIDREWRMLGDSPAMASLHRSIERIAPSSERVLITGENGAGKELVARRVHLLSDRAAGPFVALNCAALPENLIESELFGHEKGAFTGAHARHAGVFEQADGGTLFLDEIGEMPLPLQPKLLRALEEGVVRPVGGTEARPVDVRAIAATNRDLRAAVDAGAFRQDLFFRLAVVPLRVPALRERSEDVAPLAAEFLVRACRRNRLGTKRFSDDALAYLRGLDWPGNVRELENFVSAAALLLEGPVLTGAALARFRASNAAGAEGTEGDLYAKRTLREFREAAEAVYLRRKLAENNGNMQRTAEAIGVARSHLYRMLERLGGKSPEDAEET